ncbi:MAG TPA: ABC transporter ATP-binding protein [Mycobacteriales bacterium]|jgi:branched-chain amino acid transport system ATP-binding protein|nr:ABC transporter ATP-binding protein [Mycobacteriales bacterium]
MGEQGPLLGASGISVRFGGLQALDTVDLQVQPDRITGLIGPNGAGKTTMFNVLTGLVAPAQGQVVLDGTEITGWAPHRRARAGIARTFQRLELFSRMTVEQNLLAAWETGHRGGGLGRGKHECRRRVADVSEMLGLGPLAERLAGQLPTGQGRLVELGRALCTDPRVLLLDEPGSGLDAAETERLCEILERLTHDGGADRLAILLVEHDMPLVMRVCDVITVLDFGKGIANGTPEQIRANPIVQAAYLGDADVA